MSDKGDCHIDTPGPRMEWHPTTKKLAQLLEAATTRSLSFVQLEEFADAYKQLFICNSFKASDDTGRPPLAGSSAEAKKIRENLHDLVIKKVNEEISIVMEEENLDKKFKDLEQLTIEFHHVPQTHTAWRPPGDAEVHMKPFNTVAKLEERNRLMVEVNSERDKLNIMKTRVEKKRKQILNLNEAIQVKSGKLDEVDQEYVGVEPST